MTPEQQKRPSRPRSKRKAGKRTLDKLAKLDALAKAPGTPEEGKRAADLAAALRDRYDCTKPEEKPDDLFYGRFRSDSIAVPIADIEESQVQAAVKWAIESRTGIKCLYQGARLCALAEPDTADKLRAIARTIADGFRALWSDFQAAPIAARADGPLFYRGLYDGMMDEQRPDGEPLPARSLPKRQPRAKRRALAHLAGLNLHPYSLAVELGKQIRFKTPVEDIRNQLNQRIAGALAA